MPEQVITCPNHKCDYGYPVSKIEDNCVLDDGGDAWRDQCPLCGTTFVIKEKEVTTYVVSLWVDKPGPQKVEK